MLEYNFTLDGSVLLEGDPVDPHECYLLQSVDGLDGRELRDEVLVLPGRDGDVFGPQTVAGVALSVEGLIVSRTPQGLRSKERVLRKVCAGGRGLWPLMMTGRVGDTVPLALTVRAGQRFRCVDTVDGARLVKAFQFTVRSEDPYWQASGPASSSDVTAQTPGGLVWPVVWPVDWGAAVGAGTVIMNSGDASVWPVLTVTGPCVNYQLENATVGKSIYLTTTVAEGEQLVIDTRERTAMVGSVNKYRDVVRELTEWWQLAPDGNDIRFRPATWSGAAKLTVSWRDGYL